MAYDEDLSKDLKKIGKELQRIADIFEKKQEVKTEILKGEKKDD